MNKNTIPDSKLIEQAASLLRDAKYAVALTGAGISTPSGIPDFRSPKTGLWEMTNPMEVASIYGFRRNPKAFYEWMRPLARLVRDAQPNPAHIALARLEELGFIKAVITQNVDRLHTRAGSRKIYEVHGNNESATCLTCFRVFPSEAFMERFIETGDVPYCSHCGGVLKPNVILFGEQLPAKVIRSAQRESQMCDLMLVAGSYLSVAPVSNLPLVALAHGAKVIIVNYEKTYADNQASVVIHADVAMVLPDIVEVLEGGKDENDTV